MSAVHLHLVLNHVPVLGVVFAFGLLLFAFVKPNRGFERLSLTLFVLIALAAIPVYLTGEPSEDAVEHLPGVSEAIIEQHEESATVALASMEALGLLGIVGLIVSRAGKPVPRWIHLSSLALSLVASVLMLRTATLGGQIRHTEIRSGAPVPSEAHAESDDT